MLLVVEMVSIEFAVPPPTSVILLGFRLVVSPAGVDEDVRDTVPEKLLRLVTLMVEVPDEPPEMMRLVGLADREKLGGGEPVTDTNTNVECDSDPLVPVTVTKYEPGGVEVATVILTTEEPDPPGGRGMLVRLSFAVIPLDEVVSVNVIVPLKPFRLVRVITELPDDPAAIVMLDGLELIAKSGLA